MKLLYRQVRVINARDDFSHKDTIQLFSPRDNGCVRQKKQLSKRFALIGALSLLNAAIDDKIL